MQLYQKRSFGAYFSDTFKFLRLHGKHFYRSYLLINGVFILILLAMSYFIGQFYSEFLTNSINPNAGAEPFEAFLNNNLGALIGFGLFFFLVAVLAAMVNYSFTPLYLLKYTETKGTSFTTKDIVQSYKEHAGKLVVYFLAAIPISLIAIPVLVIAMMLVAITIIGSPLVFMVLGFGMLVYHSWLMQYLYTGKNVFEAFTYALQLPFKRFWATAGCVGLFLLLVFIVRYVVSIVPYIIFGVGTAFGIENNPGGRLDPTDTMSSMMIAMIASMMLSYLISILLNTILQLNQGIIYFSIKEELENIHTKSTIDQIGANA